MKREQFLLLKLIEECTEVVQRASKQIQFGKYEVQKDQPYTNAERLKQELLDLHAVRVLLLEAGEIPETIQKELDEAYDKKKAKIQKYLDPSYELKQLPRIQI